MLTGMEQSGLQSWWNRILYLGFAVAAASEDWSCVLPGYKPILILGYTFEEDYEL